jgi:hypothetical protein
VTGTFCSGGMAVEYLSRIACSHRPSGDAGFAPVAGQKSANCFKLSRRHIGLLHPESLTAAGSNCPPGRHSGPRCAQVSETVAGAGAID